MGFKELSSLETEKTIAIGGFNKKERKDNPTSIEGYYIGTRQVPSKLAKSGFADLHVFQTSQGNIGVWGKTDLDKKIRQVTPGTMTRVVYGGTKPTKMGEMHTYKVAVDDENTIEVVGADTSNQGVEASGAQDDSDDGYNTVTDDDSGAEEYAPAPQAIAPQQVNNERAAKVAALLKGKKPA